MILEIVSYLSGQDLINLCISKCFAPFLLSYSGFYHQLHTYLEQCFLRKNYRKHNLFEICTLTPFLSAPHQITLGVNTESLLYFHRLHPTHQHLVYLHTLKDIPFIFKSFGHYKKSLKS